MHFQEQKTFQSWEDKQEIVCLYFVKVLWYLIYQFKQSATEAVGTREEKHCFFFKGLAL